jgi:predicted alpha/beta-hydrolase family hydrolase
MKQLTETISIDAQARVSALLDLPSEAPTGGHALILAHGAGNDMHAPLLAHVAAGIARLGFPVLRFNFPYKERGAKVPDRAAKLESCWRAVADHLAGHPAVRPRGLFLGGKSLGGRMASYLAAHGYPCAGLVFLGYPLHPPNRPEKLRAEHLADIACPMLFIQGTRDPFCRLDLLEPILERLPAPTALHRIEGGEHSFKLPKRLGRSEQQVWDEVARTAGEWMLRAVEAR